MVLSPTTCRRAAAAVILVLALSACEMTVRLTTTVHADGGGTFALGMALDDELVDQIEELARRDADGGVSLEPIQSLFDGLARAGWTVDRAEPEGGLTFEATRSFADADDFGRVLSELRTARTSEGTGFGEVRFELDVGSESSFLRSRQTFRGRIDTSQPGASADQQARADIVARLLTIEIVTAFAGSVGEVEGPGEIGEGRVVWRPVFGTATTFAATSSSLRVGSLLLVLLPGLVVLGGAGWFALGRRRQRGDDGSEDLLVIQPEPSSRGEGR